MVAGACIGVFRYFMVYVEPPLVPVLPEQFIECSFWLQVNPDSRQLSPVRTTIDYIVSLAEANRQYS